MRRITMLPLIGGIFLIYVQTVHGSTEVDFNRDIRPILAEHCFACHGPDEEAREAGLRLDTAEGLTEDRGGYRVVEAGNPDESELVVRIESDDPDLQMPPADAEHTLSETQRNRLRQWVAEGAEYETHWAFVPPRKAPLPAVDRENWPRQPLDYFVLAKLEAAGLDPATTADRYRLIRRVSLDLTGLPPTPEAADAFFRDRRPDAYEQLVDRLLASPAFGEHWARTWLDLARYADTKGYEKDKPRDIWPYRDWVIEALNRDLPFDQFTREQLAGDLLPDATNEQRIATAFHRNTMTNDEGGTDNEEFRIAAVKDRVDTTIQVWMGLTMGCAKCHSHKFDPLSQRDYYEFMAFFDQTEDADRSDDAPTLPVPTTIQQHQLAAAQTALAERKAAIGESPTEAEEAELQQLEASLAEVRQSIPRIPVMQELPKGKQRTTHIHNRGNFLDPGDEVAPAVPNLFGSLPEDAPPNRLGVAQWLMQDENPLTARVMVNRVWARLFGTGIVETEEDFGTQGMLPTHPQLLDWLAVDFREHNWSLKKLLRTIVLSATYRQSARVSGPQREADPQNQLYSRGPRFRLPAETIRDQALAVCGLLTNRISGPSVMPPQPPGIWRSTYSDLQWENASGADRFRRGLYTYKKRTSPYPAMLTFDAGSGEVCLIRRVRTNTPLQALVTLNDPVYVEAAGALATEMSRAGTRLDDQLQFGFRRVLIRPPDDLDIQRLLALYDNVSEDFAANPESAEKLLRAAGLQEGDAALVCVANVLLNLDETLMKP